MNVKIPSFEEFKQNRERFIGRDDESLSGIDRGSVALNKQTQKHIYEIEGYRCRTLEEVERVAACQGIPLRELDYRPCAIPTGAGKCDILVRFLPKQARARRDAW